MENNKKQKLRFTYNVSGLFSVYDECSVEDCENRANEIVAEKFYPIQKAIEKQFGIYLGFSYGEIYDDNDNIVSN